MIIQALHQFGHAIDGCAGFTGSAPRVKRERAEACSPTPPLSVVAGIYCPCVTSSLRHLPEDCPMLTLTRRLVLPLLALFLGVANTFAEEPCSTRRCHPS